MNAQLDRLYDRAEQYLTCVKVHSVMRLSEFLANWWSKTPRSSLPDGSRFRTHCKPCSHRAFRLCQQGCKQGDARFIIMMGFFYEHGLVVKKSEEAAFEYYEAAANAGHPQAMYNMGVKFERAGEYLTAIEWWEKAASESDSYSMIKLGWVYEQGNGVLTDAKKAVDYYEQAAAADNVLGMLELVRCHREQIGVKKDVAKMADLLELARAKDHPRAWSETGWMYDDGDLPAEDPRSKAIECYENAAKLGSASSQAWCAEWFLMSEFPQPKKGMRYLNWALKADQRRAKYLMAVLLARGQGMKKDSKRAFQLCRESAQRGEVDAQNMLGLMFERGDGVKPAAAQAKLWLKMAADNGHEFAREHIQHSSHKAES